MSGRILPFPRRASGQDWSAEELAEFYRVEDALFRSGLTVNSDRGVTDEGDPWFIFFRPDDEEVVVHFARIGRRYLLSAPAYGADVTGEDFTLLVRGLLERQPPLAPRSRANLIIHPASLLVVLVASALLKSGHSAHAAESFSAAERAVPVRSPPSAPGVTVSSSALLTEDEQNLVLNAVAIVGAAADATPITAPVAQVLSDSTVDFGFHNAVLRESVSSIGAFSEPAVAPALSLAPMTAGAAPGLSDVHPTATFAIPSAVGSSVPAAIHVPVVMAASSSVQTFDSAPTSTVAHPQAIIDAAASPHDAAVLVVDSLGADVPVMRTADIPGALVEIMHNGTHDPGGSSAEASRATGSNAGAHSVPPAGASIEQEASAAQPVQTAAPTGPVSTVAVATTASAPAVNPQAAELQIALADIKQFVGEVLHPKVLLTTNSVIVYDADAVDHGGPLVTSLTFDFNDGTSISLVGVPAELAHLHVLSA